MIPSAESAIHSKYHGIVAVSQISNPLKASR
jgi:hypothetical protein